MAYRTVGLFAISVIELKINAISHKITLIL